MKGNPFDVACKSNTKIKTEERPKGQIDEGRDRANTGEPSCVCRKMQVGGNTNAATVQENVAELQFGPEFDNIHGVSRTECCLLPTIQMRCFRRFAHISPVLY